MKVKLIPTELRCVSSTICKRDYERELTEALLRLKELQELASNVSSDDEKSIVSVAAPHWCSLFTILLS